MGKRISWGFIATFATVLILFVAGCHKDDDDDAPAPSPVPGPVSYMIDVWPILQARCASCHNPGGIAAFVGMNFTTAGTAYSSLVNSATSPPTGVPSSTCIGRLRVVPSDGVTSFLFEKINTDTPQCGTRMPQGGAPLSTAEQVAIMDWIDQGASP